MTTNNQFTREYRQALVKILAPSIKFNWITPFNKRTGTAIGTGFFIDGAGHILTNAHVVDSSIPNKIQIIIPFESQRKFSCKVLGICFDFDLALLKVQGYRPKYFFPLGDDKQVRIGDIVTALGFPLGKEDVSLTQGVISGREQGMLQTDSALNPGNSGGPLIKNGQVVGINFSVMLNATNIGFARPISNYYVIADEIKQGQRTIVRRPALGFEYNPVNQAMLDMAKSPCGDGGVYISIVYPGSSSEKVGLKKNDIICSLNQKSIDRYGMVASEHNIEEKVHLSEVIDTIKNHTQMSIVYWNHQTGQVVDTKILVEPYQFAIRRYHPSFEEVDYEVFAGMIVMNLTINHVISIEKLSKYKQTRYRSKPQLILTKIIPGSELDQMDIFRNGDILSEINNQPVSNLNEYRKAVKNSITINGGRFLKIMNDRQQTVVLNLAQVLKQEPETGVQLGYPPSHLYKYFMDSSPLQQIKQQTPKSTKLPEFMQSRLGQFNHPETLQIAGSCCGRQDSGCTIM